MKPLPIGIQTFRDLRNGNYLYVDKTKQIYKLIEHSKGAYFLARPRRFGKSLTLSVLDEIFSANRELFQGLWIYNSNWNWKKFPVLRFDFSQQKAKNTEELTHFIFTELELNAHRYNIQLQTKEYFAQFRELILKASETEQVVILIDEYDKPIIDHLENPELAKEMREVMKGFFTVLKGSDPYIRFLLLTGVSKFSKAGVFSNLNHLEDISFLDEFSTLLGITEEELEIYFKDYLHALSEKEKLNYNETLSKIREWYNGYKFSAYGISVYNPFSTLLLLKHQVFKHHWFETGTPEFLVKLILQNEYDITEIPFQTEELEFESYEVEDLRITPLLFQTGYLTIKEYNSNQRVFTLDYPNFEVKHAFLNYIFKKIQKKSFGKSPTYTLYEALQKEEMEQVFRVLRNIFANVDYSIQIEQEKYYQTIFYLIFHLLGIYIRTEVYTNLGRIDAVIESNSIYVFEFKLNGSKEEALEQIKKQKYYEKYLSWGKRIYLVGVEFKDRNVGEYMIEIMNN